MWATICVFILLYWSSCVNKNMFCYQSMLRNLSFLALQHPLCLVLMILCTSSVLILVWSLFIRFGTNDFAEKILHFLFLEWVLLNLRFLSILTECRCWLLDIDAGLYLSCIETRILLSLNSCLVSLVNGFVRFFDQFGSFVVFLSISLSVWSEYVA